MIISCSPGSSPPSDTKIFIMIEKYLTIIAMIILCVCFCMMLVAALVILDKPD